MSNFNPLLWNPRVFPGGPITFTAFMARVGFRGIIYGVPGTYEQIVACSRCDWEITYTEVMRLTVGVMDLCRAVQAHAASHLPLPPEPPDPAAGYAGADLVTQIDPLKGYSGLRGL